SPAIPAPTMAMRALEGAARAASGTTALAAIAAAPATNWRRDGAPSRSAISSATEMFRLWQRLTSEESVLRNCNKGVRATMAVSFVDAVIERAVHPLRNLRKPRGITDARVFRWQRVTKAP